MLDDDDERPVVTAPPRFGTEPIVGWRCWAVIAASPELGLLSPYRRVIWKPRARFETQAPVTHDPHATRAGEMSGVYAWRDRDGLDGWRRNEFRFIEVFHRMRPGPYKPGDLHYVFGRVSLWGRVIEHELGYRAQYAYPYDLMTTEPKIASWLRALYAVDARVDEYARYPTLTAPNMSMALAKHGLASPNAVR